VIWKEFTKGFWRVSEIWNFEILGAIVGLFVFIILPLALLGALMMHSTEVEGEEVEKDEGQEP